MSYNVYKKHVNKYGKKVSSGATTQNSTQSVYLFAGRSITPDKTKQIINVKKNTGVYGRSSGASTDRTHNLNRNLSLTAIGGAQADSSQTRNIEKKERIATLKSKGSISSSSSNNHASNAKTSTSKTIRNTATDEIEGDSKLLQTVKLLKTENKRLYGVLKETEKNFSEKLRDCKKEMEKMTTIINQLWPFIQSHLRREIGSDKIANLKKMAKEESRVSFLETLSNVIDKVKKNAEKEGRGLFGTDIENRYEKLKKDYSKFDQIEKDLK